MLRLAEVFEVEEIVYALSRQLSWTHLPRHKKGVSRMRDEGVKHKTARQDQRIQYAYGCVMDGRGLVLAARTEPCEDEIPLRLKELQGETNKVEYE